MDWAGLFKGNRFANSGLTLSYITSKIVDCKILVQLEKGEVDSKMKKWKSALLTYVIGDIRVITT